MKQSVHIKSGFRISIVFLSYWPGDLAIDVAVLFRIESHHEFGEIGKAQCLSISVMNSTIFELSSKPSVLICCCGYATSGWLYTFSELRARRHGQPISIRKRQNYLLVRRPALTISGTVSGKTDRWIASRMGFLSYEKIKAHPLSNSDLISGNIIIFFS